MTKESATELEQFLLFIQAKLAAGDIHVSPQEALDDWRLENPTAEGFRENVRAIKVALNEMDAGAIGISADESVRRLSVRLAAARRTKS